MHVQDDFLRAIQSHNEFNAWLDYERRLTAAYASQPRSAPSKALRCQVVSKLVSLLERWSSMHFVEPKIHQPSNIGARLISPELRLRQTPVTFRAWKKVNQRRN